MKIIFILSMLIGTACADELIIATEFEFENDTITVGVIGYVPLSLYTQGDSTIGIAGDTVISIDRSYRPRLDIEVDPDLFSEEDIGYPLEERRD